MKTALLKKMRDIGRSQINIISTTKSNNIIIGMSIGMNDNKYKGLFEIGNTENEVKDKAMRIWLYDNIPFIRNKYKKYSRRLNTSQRIG